MISCKQRENHSFELLSVDGTIVNGPVSIAFSEIKFEHFGLFNDGKPVAYQIDSLANRVWFLHKAGSSSTYTIESIPDSTNIVTQIATAKKSGDLQLTISDNPVLQDRYAMTYPPKEVDSIFRKSGYIHPIITQKGDTFTRIQAPDHYHHYGLWGPWTNTRIDTMRVDFWNLAERQGTVLFKELNSITSGPAFSDFNAAQEHIDLKTQEKPQVALNENLGVRLWNLQRPDRYMFDYISTFSSPLDNGILFEAYRYGGGIGMRFHERWHKDNCEVLTSEGKNRLDADGTNARWAIVSGESSDGKGSNGILFMSHPENRMHPEPMRVWPVDANGGRGDMFFEFCPIRHEEWKIAPNEEYQLNYRMVVFDGKLTAEEAEAYWQSFADPLKVNLMQN